MGYIDKFITTYANGVDAVVILNDVNRYYFTGYDSSFGVLLFSNTKKVLLTDPRYSSEATLHVKDDIEVVSGDFAIAFDYLKQFVVDNQIKTLGFENATILHEEYLSLSSIKDVKLVPVSQAISDMRAIKTEQEIEYIKKAAQISDKSLQLVQKKIRAGMTEIDLVVELEYQMRLLGADGAAFDTVVAFGNKTAYPHAHSGNVKLEKGMPILIDFGAKYNHYCSDTTRMLSLGEPSTQIRAIHSSVLSAQKYALSAMNAGLTGREVDAFAREYLKSRGLGEYFTHGLGHGLGLEIHESPTVSKRNYNELLPNMVVTCEPGVYMDGIGGVRIEDTVLIKDSGIELLNSLSKEIIIL